MLRSLIALTLLVTTASAHEFELSAGFTRGEWEADGIVRGLVGGDGSLGWSHDHWQARISGRMMTGVRDDAGECGDDPCPPSSAADVRHVPLGALTVGWAGEWAALSVGAALRIKDTDDGGSSNRFGPAGLLRLGPKVAHLAVSVWEPSSALMAPGRTRIGVGTQINNFKGWIGYVTDDAKSSGLGLGIETALSPAVGFVVGTAFSSTPSEFLLLRVGLTYVLGAPDLPREEPDNGADLPHPKQPSGDQSDDSSNPTIQPPVKQSRQTDVERVKPLASGNP